MRLKSDFSQPHFTGKERDAESGNDYFGARYYSSAMGRMLSPDPSNIGANSANPQTWNMYSYGLNNPLVLTDPTGLYVCEDNTDCSSQNDKHFAASLSQARSAADAMDHNSQDYKDAMAAINSYGEMGVDNGVNVRFDENISEPSDVTEISGVANGNKSADNPNGQNINVTFKPSAFSEGNQSSGSSAGLVAHEGSHVADGSAWVASGFSAALNPTRLNTEMKANAVGFNVGQAFLQSQNWGTWQGHTGQGVPFNEKTTFKMIAPDVKAALIKQLGDKADQPAGVKGWRLEP